MVDRDLTLEGQKILDNILNYDRMAEEGFQFSCEPPEPPTVIKRSKTEKEIDGLRYELYKLILNSKMIVEDCKEIIAKIDTAEEYIKCDAKVAMELHGRLIGRLEKVIAGLPAFQDESHLIFDRKKIQDIVIKLRTSR